MSYVTSAELVSHDDLLKQILFRLPVRSLVGFKCVSKHWQSLISTHLLNRNHNPKLISPSGLFIRRINRTKPEFAFVSFDRVKSSKPPLKSFDFVKFDKELLKPCALGIIKVVQSCNGLLLCRTLTKNYYVYNPTTNQFTTIPKHDRDDYMYGDPRGMTLVFDPLKSPHYKLVCVRIFGRIQVYSSENRIWMAPSNKLLMPIDERLDFVAGVYCNGAVHWDFQHEVFYYKMDKKNKNCLYTISLPNYVFNQSRYNRRRCYPSLVESRDSLFFFDVFHSCVEVDIYQMQRDYSGWFKMYHVNLSVMHKGVDNGNIESYVKHQNSYVVHCFLPTVGEEEAFLVIETPNNVIMRYNLESKTYQKLCDLESSNPSDSWAELYDRGLRSFPYIESLSHV